MKVNGIRIFNSIDVSLINVLEDIESGELFSWSILYIEAIAKEDQTQYLPGNSIPDFENLVNDSEKGYLINWKELLSLSRRFHQIRDLVLIGSKEQSSLHRYEEDQKMIENCDIVIQMIDSSYWEIYSKNENFLKKLCGKYDQVKLLKRGL